MVVAAARVVEPMIGHELQDLQRAMVALHVLGERDGDALGAVERLLMLEDAVRQDREDRVGIDRGAAAIGGPRRHHRLHRDVAGAVDAERDPVMTRVEDGLVDGDGDFLASLISGDLSAGRRSPIIAAGRRLLGVAEAVLLQRGGGLRQDEMGVRRGGRPQGGRSCHEPTGEQALSRAAFRMRNKHREDLQGTHPRRTDAAQQQPRTVLPPKVQVIPPRRQFRARARQSSRLGDSCQQIEQLHSCVGALTHDRVAGSSSSIAVTSRASRRRREAQ